MSASPDALFAALDATWPAAQTRDHDGWRLRRGEGGGKRVSAAGALTAGEIPDIDAACAAMRDMGQTPLFSLRPGEEALDAALADRGFEVVDRTVIYAGDPAALAALPLKKGVRWVEVRARLALLDEIWEAGGIGPARRAVMARCEGPRATIMARTDAAVAGCAHVAVAGEVAMIHAAEIRVERRREGGGRALLAGAAQFALDRGARIFALAVTERNAAARALYDSAGMSVATGYHYRILAG